MAESHERNYSTVIFKRPSLKNGYQPSGIIDNFHNFPRNTLSPFYSSKM